MTTGAALRRAGAVPLAVRHLVALLVLESRLRRWTVLQVARRYGLDLLSSPEPALGDFDVATLDGREVRDLRVLRWVLRLPGVDGSCLRSAILTGRALRARRPALVLGAAKSQGVVRAHAWLRIDGLDLDLDRGTGFHPFVVESRGA